MTELLYRQRRGRSLISLYELRARIENCFQSYPGQGLGRWIVTNHILSTVNLSFSYTKIRFVIKFSALKNNINKTFIVPNMTHVYFALFAHNYPYVHLHYQFQWLPFNMQSLLSDVVNGIMWTANRCSELLRRSTYYSMFSRGGRARR